MESLSHWRQRVEQALEHALPSTDLAPSRLHQAMRYTMLGGGKRLRPILVYATGQALGMQPNKALDAAACAVELIHGYSLVHDDMPLMDNDDLRRGRPTCHKAFDEVTALLVGDGLQTLAFELLTNPQLEARVARDNAFLLAQAAGSQGMVGGQAIDLAATGKKLSLSELQTMHLYKTGALIRASILLAATAAQGSVAQKQALDHYGKCIGLAFQICDDCLDVTSDTATLGKPQGSDQDHDKMTYPSLLGLDQSIQQAKQLIDQALESLQAFDSQADGLRFLARYVIERVY